jgi:hypothetical protein
VTGRQVDQARVSAGPVGHAAARGPARPKSRPGTPAHPGYRWILVDDARLWQLSGGADVGHHDLLGGGRRLVVPAPAPRSVPRDSNIAAMRITSSGAVATALPTAAGSGGLTRLQA